MGKLSNPTPTTSCCSGGAYRRRRIFWFTALLLTAIFVFGTPWHLPEYLKDVDGINISRASIAKLAQLYSGGSKVDEIYVLLHLVTAPKDSQLGDAANVDWAKETKLLKEKYPIVVFSKVRQLTIDIMSS
jgi:hypothetical protein